jgi:hypothetical protein
MEEGDRVCLGVTVNLLVCDRDVLYSRNTIQQSGHLRASVGDSREAVPTLKKRLAVSRPGMSLTKLFLYLFPPRESLVSDIPAGDGKPLTFFTVI